MELFDLTKIIFEKPGEWQNVSNLDKKKWFFLINRRFGIQHPIQAAALQHTKIEISCVLDFRQRFMYKTYGGKTPGWMYTVGVKKAKENKETKTKISESLVAAYAKKLEIDKKSIYDAIEFYPDLIQSELRQFQKMIEQK